MTRVCLPTRLRFQRGSIVRGAMVATALVGALGLQLAGPRLQCRLAALVGIAWTAPEAMPMAPTPASSMSAPCGSQSSGMSSYPCKVAKLTSHLVATL